MVWDILTNSKNAVARAISSMTSLTVGETDLEHD